MSRLTKTIGSPATTKENSTILWDDEVKGFGVRIIKDGTKSLFLNYRNAHEKQRRIKLGRFGIVTLEEARKKARKELNKVAHGHDPQKARAVAHGEITFAGLAEEYIRPRCSQKKSGPEDERMLRKDFLPLWGASSPKTSGAMMS